MILHATAPALDPPGHLQRVPFDQRVYAPETSAAATLLVLQGLQALIAQGRAAAELRVAARNPRATQPR